MKCGQPDVSRIAPIIASLMVVSLVTTPAMAQQATYAIHTDGVGGGVSAELSALERGRYAVVVDLDENLLHFKQGETVLWSAPVGTGTGMRLITDDDDWDFSTPTGTFQVEYKELDPVWIAPDWYFVRNNLRVPPQNDPSRYFNGTLGAAAVYIAPYLAIHGTDQPDLLGQRVSHGCIRLEDRYARRLYHNVQVGTEVIIVGGEDVKDNAPVFDVRDGWDPALQNNRPRRPAPADPVYSRWTRMSTDRLLGELDDELAKDVEESRWDEVVIILLGRIDEDDDALAGILRRTNRLPSKAVELEWATFLASAYRQAPVRTLEAMSALNLRDRRHVAESIVTASLTLYNGGFERPSAPWPSRRIPADVVPSGAERGWNALVSAERERRNDETRAAAAR
jgi:lipoprotein-anchoring transpeptidase ErfK/SrfK